MMTTVQMVQRRIDGAQAVGVSIVGDKGRFVDVFWLWADARKWAIDVLVAYFNHTTSEAERMVDDGNVTRLRPNAITGLPVGRLPNQTGVIR